MRIFTWSDDFGVRFLRNAIRKLDLKDGDAVSLKSLDAKTLDITKVLRNSLHRET